MRHFAFIIISVCLACLLLIFLVQRRMLFPAHYAPRVPDSPQLGPEVTRLWIESDSARAEAWFVPGHGVTTDSPGPVVLFAHGNAEVIDYIAPLMSPYRDAGISVALLEYRGYGRSTGGPSEEGLIADGLALVERLKARPDVDPEQILLHGRSLGGGVVCGIAESFSPRAVILESTFASVTRLAWEMWLPGILVRDTFESARRLAELETPVLLLHGQQDQLVPVSHAHRLKDAAPNSTLHVWPAGHNDLGGVSAYWPTILDFVRMHTRPVQSKSRP